MRDEPPMIFARNLGALYPQNRAAEDALVALKAGEPIAVKFGKGGWNQRRLGFYWVMLTVAAEHLSDRIDGHLDAEQLHRLLKRKLKLGTEIALPSGEVFFDEESISVAAMSEPDRARWVDRVSTILAHWLGVPVNVLMDEARTHERRAA